MDSFLRKSFILIAEWCIFRHICTYLQICVYILCSSRQIQHFIIHFAMDSFLRKSFILVVGWGVAYICTYWYILAHMCVYVAFKSTPPTFHYKFRDWFVLTGNRSFQSLGEIVHFNRRMLCRIYLYILVHSCTYVYMLCLNQQIRHFIINFAVDSFLRKSFILVVEWGVAYICTYWYILVHMCVYMLLKQTNQTFHYKFHDGFVLKEIFHFSCRMVYICTYWYILVHMCLYFVSSRQI